METSQMCLLESKPTSLRPDSPVSPTLAPGSDWARKMTAQSGRSLSMSFDGSSRIGAFLKTLLGSSKWRSMACWLTWKRKVTKSGRWYFQLVPSMPSTGGIGSGLWPTPRASEAEHPGRKSINHGGQTGLAEAANLWPTPTARDWKDGPATSCANVPVNGLLGRSVHFPTPTANRRSGLQSHGINVVEGSLNPQFCEYLMGFPTDWTKTD